ncbi:MAG: WYL domain-containing protein [Acidimicrobiia bacterium]
MVVKSKKHQLRLARLITLAYLLSTRSEIHIEELCERLGENRETIEEDLNVLMFCGLPPYSPEQLFDISIEDDFVSMYFNNVFVSPLRLNESERNQVIIALARLRASSTIDSEIKNIDEISKIIDSSFSESIDIETNIDHIDVLNDGIENKCAVSIEYLSLNSASIDIRNIFPISIYSSASTAYVFAYDSNYALKLYRIDRILSANIEIDTKLDSSKTQNGDPDIEDDIGQHIFISNEENYVDFIINEGSYWLIDSYPNELIDEIQNIYRFQAPSPYFIARLMLSNFENIVYFASSYEKNTIVDAINKIEQQMRNTAGINE